MHRPERRAPDMRQRRRIYEPRRPHEAADTDKLQSDCISQKEIWQENGLF